MRNLLLATVCGTLALSSVAVVTLAEDSQNLAIKIAPGDWQRSETVVDAQQADASFRIDLSEEMRSKAVDVNLLPRDAKSLLRVRTTLKHGEYIWNDTNVPDGPITVFVDVRRQMMSVFRGGHEIGTAVVVYGGGGHESPLGKFPILSKFRDYHSRTYDAPMPHSMFLTRDGVAIHGNVMAANRATKGCIGLPPEFAKLLFDVAKPGDVVQITRSEQPA